jgi:hypothetical protein
MWALRIASRLQVPHDCLLIMWKASEMTNDERVVAGHVARAVDRMNYRLLGPVEMLRDGVPIDLGVLKQRALMAMLLIHANRVVSTDALIDELWAGDAGKERQNALWVNISRLRSTLEPDRAKRTDGTVLVTRPPGYVPERRSGSDRCGAVRDAHPGGQIATRQ